MSPTIINIPFDSGGALDRYIKFRGGSRSLRKILVASNGLAAIKFIKSIRLWCQQTLGDRNAVKLLAMCSEDDRRNFNRFLDFADSVALVDGGKSSINYGNVSLIVSIATQN